MNNDKQYRNKDEWKQISVHIDVHRRLMDNKRLTSARSVNEVIGNLLRGNQ